MELTVALEACEEGGYTAFVPSLPGCISEGETVDEAMNNIREAIDLYLEDVEEDFIAGENIQIKKIEHLHTKGLVGDNYRLFGSMNFTFNGIEINDESLHLDSNPESVARSLAEFEQQYGDKNA